MKKILITGANSYVGTSFEKYIKDNYPNDYQIDTLDMMNPDWRNHSFSGYDSVYHVAGIAHSDTGKISKEKEQLYRSINTDLTIETAKKAKVEGVKQFIFMSSAIVYGDSAPIGKEKIITKDTKPNPSNCYGDSKLQAEIGLQQLEDINFKVVILRPPMIYGKGCKGNFKTLEKLALTLPIFPKVENKRSMLYIGNLVEFVRLMIENNEQGIFWPQNKEYSNTSELVKLISQANNRKIILVPGFTWLLKILSHFTGLVNKVFGSLTYEICLSGYRNEYRRYPLKKSVNLIEVNKWCASERT